MYTVSSMSKTAGEKRPSVNFQFKIFGDEVERWKDIVRVAKMRAIARYEKASDTDINRALVGLETKKKWLVTEEERAYFFKRTSVLSEPIPKKKDNKKKQKGASETKPHIENIGTTLKNDTPDEDIDLSEYVLGTSLASLNEAAAPDISSESEEQDKTKKDDN